MFSPQMYKALRGLVGQRPVATPLSLRQQQHGHRAMCVASAAQSHLGPVLQFIAKGSLRLGSSAALLAGTAYALAQSNRASEDDPDHGPLDGGPAWLKELASREGVDEVLSPGQQLRKHPVGKLVVEQDHLFETMVVSGQIKELRCFYDNQKRVFYSVVELGKEVCGFPQTVHGGLTAALVDETVGGLAVALWRSGALGFRPPAYTARLEVDYKKKIPNGSVILVTTEVEELVDRKVWMRATVTNGKSTVYATARALFVSPRWLPDWIKSMTGGGGKGGNRKAPK